MKVNFELYPRVPSQVQPATPKELRSPSPANLRQPQQYLAEPGLVDAVNVALALHQPLIVTGEPGTGKTVLAWSVAWELGLDPPLVFETKSTTQAKDLFYYYDTLGRFTAKELGAVAANAQNYITFNALGAAIVFANDPDSVADILPPDFKHGGKRLSVVLIDEVEKAPRDFANDVLNELERMYFRIPEMNNRLVVAEEAAQPIVIMTNNSEKSLPDAFLRRCIYYNIEFPSKERLEEIVMRRLPQFTAGDYSAILLKDSINFILKARADGFGLEKRPGTAELLNWLSAMSKMNVRVDMSLAAQKEIAFRALPALVKISGDHALVRELLGSWQNGGCQH
jgi:MoxR-like ATPase